MNSKGSDLKKLGDRLNDLRTEKGLTLEALALECDIELSQVHRIETGKINPTYTTLQIIAKGLGVTLSEFTKGL